MKKLEYLLDAFAEKYSDAEVIYPVLDLKHIFFNRKTGLYEGPRNFSIINNENEETAVATTIVKNGPRTEKYLKQKNGKVLRDKKGNPYASIESMEAKILSCLCIKPIRNTSYYEIAAALETTDNIQGWTIRKITETAISLQRTSYIKGKIFGQTYEPFQPEKDNAFFFVDTENNAYDKANLNSRWFTQILEYGSKATKKISNNECIEMRRLFPAKVLQGNKKAIQENSYMWNRLLHTNESVEFLKKKIEVYQKFVK